MDSGQHQDIFSMYHSFLDHFWSQDRHGIAGGNPVQWMMDNHDKIPSAQDVFKSMLQAGADSGAQTALAPIQSLFDGMGMGGAFKQ